MKSSILAIILLVLTTVAWAHGTKKNSQKECDLLLQRVSQPRDISKLLKPIFVPKSKLRQIAEEYGARFVALSMEADDLEFRLKLKNKTWIHGEASLNLLFDGLNGTSTDELLATRNLPGMGVTLEQKWRVVWIFDLDVLDRPDVYLNPTRSMIKIDTHEKAENGKNGEENIGLKIADNAIRSLTTPDEKGQFRIENWNFILQEPLLLTHARALWIPQPLLQSHFNVEEIRKQPGLEKIQIWTFDEKHPSYQYLQSGANNLKIIP